MNNMREEKDIATWRANWTTANNRRFLAGEVLGVLRDCINKYLSAKRITEIVPVSGGVEAILRLIPDEHYDGVVTHLCAMKHQSNSEIVANAETPAPVTPSNNKRTLDVDADGEGSSKRSKDGDVMTLNAKRKASEFKTTENTDSLKKNKVVEVTETAEVVKRSTARSRNLLFTLKFPPAVRHYTDINEDNSFESDEIAQKFVLACKTIYPPSLTTLVEKGNASYKLQCVILTNDVGYAAAAFVIRDFKPSTVVITLPS